MEDLAGGAGAEVGQEWISATASAEMLELSRGHFLEQSIARGYTRRKAHQTAPPFFLRREIESWADMRRMRRQWLAKYPGRSGGKRYKEKIDEEIARRLFINSDEAAALLGVTRKIVHDMAHNGRLICYQAAPGHSGSRLWFSRRAILQIAEDPERLKRQEWYRKSVRGGTPRAFRTPDAGRMVRGGVPKGWLTTKEAALRLGVGMKRVGDMRKTGRLRGEQIWRRGRPLKFWYYPDYEVERAIAWRQEAREAKGQPLLSPNPPTPGPDAFAALTGNGERVGDWKGEQEAVAVSGSVPSRRGRARVERDSMRLDADGPEPKWACDDVDLTRAFFLMDRP